MQDGRQISEKRKGIIDNQEIEYIVTVNVKNGHIIEAEGEIIKPINAHKNFIGATYGLQDIETSNIFDIFVSTNRFSFSISYNKIDTLF